MRLGLMALVLAIFGACTVPLAFYDTNTYQHLVDLRVDCMEVLESFGTDTPASDERIADVRRALLKAWEYEKGKPDNADTSKQFEILLKRFDEDLADYREGDDNGRVYYSEAAKALGREFDKVIDTEALKNKGSN